MKVRRLALPIVAAALAVSACSAGGPPSGPDRANESTPSASGPVSPGDGVNGDPSGAAPPDGSVSSDRGVPDGASSGGAATAVGSGDPTAVGPSDEPSSPAAPTTREIGASVHFAGFVLTVKTLTYTPASDLMPPQVTLDALFINKGDRNGQWDVMSEPIDLASGDHHYRPDSDSDFPTVPGQRQGEGEIVFFVDDDFSADNAVLTIGSAAQVQSVMPLGATGALTDNAPQKVGITGAATSGPLTVTITGAVLRADLPKAFTQAENDTRELLIDFKVTNHSKRPSPYGDQVTGFDQFTLTQPSANTVTAYGLDDWYGAAPTTTVRPGDTNDGQLVVFTIDEPVGGEYTLTFTGMTDNMSGDAPPGSCTFTLA